MKINRQNIVSKDTKTKVFVVWIVILLCFSSFSLMAIGTVPVVKPETSPTPPSILAIHSPIRIDSDAGFTAPNGVTGGTGTLGDPYIIDNWNINGTGAGDCIYVGNTTKHFVIRNCSLINATVYSSPYFLRQGINLYNSTNVTIHNNTIYKWSILSGVSGGIRTYQTNNISITENNITKEKYGIYFDTGDNITIDNNNLTMQDANELYNIYGDDISNMTINNNRLYTYDNDDRAINLLTYRDIIITNNIINLSSYSVSSYYDNGCYFFASLSNPNAKLENNTISNATTCIEITGDCPNFSILNSTFNAASNARDIHIINSDGVLIDNCSFTVRIEIDSTSDYCNINNTHRYANSNTQAFYIQGDFNNITNCSVDASSYYISLGIWVTGDNNTLDNVTVRKTLSDGIRLWGNDNLLNNSLFTDLGDSINDAGVSIDGYNNTVRNVSSTHATVGINMLAQGHNTIIEDCTITYVNIGIQIDNPVWRNNIRIDNTTFDYLFSGILTQNIRYANISNNTFFGNGSLAEYGISLSTDSTHNQIYNNNISNNVWFPNGYGILMFGVSVHNNSVYHNDFHNNNYHLRNVNGANNTWDNGHQFGGNYYSDLVTTDLYHGINQNISGADNLNDTSFINNTAVDNYPLTNPFATDNTPVAEAGVDKYALMTQEFNGTNSSDAGGTTLNYTWNFTYSATPYIFYGINFSFDFLIQGVYVVTLNVTDADGNYNLNTTTVYAIPPTADAGSDDSVYRGNIYQFNGSGSFTYITNWTWNFTHNATSVYLYGTTPSFEFWELGIINVTLNVTDVSSNTDEDWMYLTVLNNPPVADAGTNQSGAKGVYVFNGSESYDSDGSITNYTWNFTYNSTMRYLYGILPNYYFYTNGSYFVTLNVTDNDGGWNNNTMWINITWLQPVADAGINQTGKRTIVFDGSGSSDPDGGVVNWTWNFTYGGGPQTIWGVGPSFDFNISGIYIVMLNVTDNDGLYAYDNVTITIIILPPVSNAGPDQAGQKGVYLFNGSSSYDSDGSITNYTWNFTYNTSAQFMYGAYPNFYFYTNGSYLVTLNVTDNDWRYNTDTLWINITWLPPVADAGPNQAGKRIITFDGSGSSDGDGWITNYTWNFTYSGPQTIWGVSPQFDFNITGVYIVMLNVTDNDGLYAYDNVTITITILPPVANAGPDQTGLRGTYDFDGSASSDADGTITNYTWTFTYNASGRTIYGISPDYYFYTDGNYQVTLNITDDDWRYDEDTMWVNITLATPVPVMSYIPFDDDKGIKTVDGSSSYDPDGYITNFTWTFTYDATPYTYYTQFFAFNFSLEGSHVITLNLTDSDALQDEDTIIITIVFKDPIANAGDDIYEQSWTDMTLNGSQSYDTDGYVVNWTWNFTYDNVTYELYGEVVTFHLGTANGTVNVTLTVTDDDGLTGTDTMIVTVINPITASLNFMVIILPLLVVILVILLVYRLMRRTQKDLRKKGGY